jgi:hypothetical protein
VPERVLAHVQACIYCPWAQSRARPQPGVYAAVHADLLARGVDADPEVVHIEGVPPMFSFRDPDGNTLRVVARNERV